MCFLKIFFILSFCYTDSIYTERYMDTPKNNPKGYENSDLMKAAEKLRGRKYLIVHGTGDDNVHIQHSMQLAKRLQRADIAFEQMVIFYIFLNIIYFELLLIRYNTWPGDIVGPNIFLVKLWIYIYILYKSCFRNNEYHIKYAI